MAQESILQNLLLSCSMQRVFQGILERKKFPRTPSFDAFSLETDE